MSEQSVVAVRRYNEAFHNVHGRLPNVRINNGWIRVNNSPKSFRPTELLEMADNLERRAREEGNRGLNVDDELRQRIINIEHQREMERELHERERREVIMRLRNDIQEAQENAVWDVRDELNARVQAQIQNEIKQVVLDDNNESRIPLQGWKKHIRKDTMVMFFNRLFQKAGNSPHNMQHMMDSFIHTGLLNEEKDCDDCELHGEMESLYDALHDKDNDIERLSEKLGDRTYENTRLHKEIVKLKQEMNELRKNSVVFSMDEF